MSYQRVGTHHHIGHYNHLLCSKLEVPEVDRYGHGEGVTRVVLNSLTEVKPELNVENKITVTGSGGFGNEEEPLIEIENQIGSSDGTQIRMSNLDNDAQSYIFSSGSNIYLGTNEGEWPETFGGLTNHIAIQQTPNPYSNIFLSNGLPTTSSGTPVMYFGTQLYELVSSEKYKKEIEDWIPDPKVLLDIPLRKWKMKSDDTEGYGFIAEDVVNKIPEAAIMDFKPCTCDPSECKCDQACENIGCKFEERSLKTYNKDFILWLLVKDYQERNAI